jgi:hypothetical protein
MQSDTLRSLKRALQKMRPLDTVTIGSFRCSAADMLGVVDNALSYRLSRDIRLAERFIERPGLRVSLEPTDIFGLSKDGVHPVRLWRGVTGRNTPVVAFIATIGFDADNNPYHEGEELIDIPEPAIQNEEKIWIRTNGK